MNKISVIIPCYNAGPFLAEAVRSVLNQDYPDFEIIVIDDGSTDDSRAVAASFGKIITLVTQQNRGGCAARNRGAELAKGAFLMFLDADDLLKGRALSALAAAHADTPRDDVITVGRWSRLKDHGGWREVDSGVPFLPPSGDPVKGWISGWYVAPCAVLWPREVYDMLGGWDETLAANQDGDLMLRALLNDCQLKYVDHSCALYRDHGNVRLSVSKDVYSERALRSRMAVLEKTVKTMEKSGNIERYSGVIGQAYHRLGRNNVVLNPILADECLDWAWRHAGRRSITGTLAHQIMCQILGVRIKEKLAHVIAQVGLSRRRKRRTNRNPTARTSKSAR